VLQFPPSYGATGKDVRTAMPFGNVVYDAALDRDRDYLESTKLRVLGSWRKQPH
jgi:hypothetical protein